MPLLHVALPLTALIALLVQALAKGRFAAPYWLLLTMYVVTYPLAAPILTAVSPNGASVDGWLLWTSRLALGSLATLCVSPLLAALRAHRARTGTAATMPPGGGSAG